MRDPKEIAISLEQIALVVDLFYDRVQLDEHLSKPFAIVKDWPTHKAIISHFWWMNLGGENYLDYQYNVALKHRAAGFTPDLLNTNWLPLFEQTMREILPESLSDMWMAQVYRIAGSLELNYNYWTAHTHN